MTLNPYARVRRGTDSSLRPILLNARMDASLKDVEADLRRRRQPMPIITQGAYMLDAGGGAGASKGYHDGGGALDFRVRHLTDSQVGELVRALRRHGWAAWLRNVQHGGFKDPHIHAVLLGDREAASGAKGQMEEYLEGGDGLTGSGKDYHARPKTIREFNYAAYVRRLRKPTVTLREFKRRHLEAALANAVKAGNVNRARRLRKWLAQLPPKKGK